MPRQRFTPHKYQHRVINWVLGRLISEGEKGCGILLDPGLGKTPTTLEIIRQLQIIGAVRKVLIIAPLRVVHSVWPAECDKWSQFHDIKPVIVHGTPSKRVKMLNTEADVYLTNPENTAWIHGQILDKDPGFDLLVVDESSNFKNWNAKRTKHLRQMLPKFRYRLILTGTPSPNGIQDLFSQMYIIDDGETLGRTKRIFEDRFFTRGGYGGYELIPRKGSIKKIEGLIKPKCIRLSEEDYLSLPEMLINDVWVSLPLKLKAAYKKIESDLFIQLDSVKDGEGLSTTVGSKYMSCRQFANGGVYDGGEEVHIHDVKTECVRGLVDELQGKPALIAFQFRHDKTRLRSAFPDMEFIDGGTKPGYAALLVDKWNAGELRLLGVQPQSLSHGVNMQLGPGRDVIWLGLTDNPETYIQFNKRIHRQGVGSVVRVHRVLARGTVDEAVRVRLETKDSSQKSLLRALGDYRNGIDT